MILEPDGGYSSVHCRFFAKLAMFPSALLAVVILVLGHGYSQAQPTIISAAKVHPQYGGIVPKKSDVIFSTRFTRPEALGVIAEYQANRVEWVYTDDANFARSLRERASLFGGALNGTEKLPSEAGYVRDFDGKILSPPWMQAWGNRYWTTTTHPDTRELITRKVQRYLALGASAIQQDEPQFQMYASLSQGGDFNESTLRGFPDWLSRHAAPDRVDAAGLTGLTGSYRDWLVSRYQVIDAEDYKKRFRQFASTPLWLDYIRWTVSEYYSHLRQVIRRESSRAIPISMNLGVLNEPLQENPQFFLAAAADYAMSETPVSDVARMISHTATIRSLGLGLAPSIMPSTIAQNRVSIAHLYALGGQVVVPWDVYDGNDENGRAKRFFGAPAVYADLYHFVRGNPALFDDLETAPIVGIVVPTAKGTQGVIRALVRRLVAERVDFAFVPSGDGNRYRVESQKVKNLRLLITTNQDSDYSASDILALEDSGVPRVAVKDLRDNRLRELRYLTVAPGSERTRVVSRANPNDPNRLVVHFIDETQAERSAEEQTCRRRVGIRKSYLGVGRVGSIKIFALGRTGSVTVDVEGQGDSYFFTVPGCQMWSVVDINMVRD